MYPSENLWIWGHPTNSLLNCFGIQKESKMSPVEGAKYLGAENIFYVPMGHPTDIEAENKLMSRCKNVGWAIEAPHIADEIIVQAKKYPNIKIGIFDDFFNEENIKNNNLNYNSETLSDIREKFHEVGMEMWMVLYTKQFDKEIMPLLKEFDGISMWFWNESDVDNFERRIEQFFKFTENKKRLIGCYLYNFGDNRGATPKKVEYQLTRHLELLKSGDINGTILHTNAVADIGLEAVETARQFITSSSIV